jgi:antitoxin MazE
MFQRSYNHAMVKRLQAIGNSSGLILDKPILELLKITPDTELDISTDGERLIITPLRKDSVRKRRLGKAQARTLKEHAETFRMLAK